MIVGILGCNHGFLPDPVKCDLLIITGDIVPYKIQFNDIAVAHWLDTRFRRWLSKHKKVVGIAGNHDWIFQRNPQLVPPGLPWTYLQDSGTIVEDEYIYGSPWQPNFHDWAFNASEDDLDYKYSHIPDNTTILVTHGPPHGVLDVTEQGERVGSLALDSRLTDIESIKLSCFSHVHASYGTWRTPKRLYVNASLETMPYSSGQRKSILVTKIDGQWVPLGHSQK